MVGEITGHGSAGHVTEGGLKKTESGKAERRAAADKIKKMIRKCKANTKAIRQMDDEQTEYLKRLREHP